MVLESELPVASDDGLGEVFSELDEAKSKELSSLADKTSGDCFAKVGEGDLMVAVDVVLGVGVGDFAFDVDCDVDEDGVGLGVGVGVGVGRA